MKVESNAADTMATGKEPSDTAVCLESTAVGSVTKEPERPQLAAQRKSSFSDAFSKITTNPFNRRRTTTLLQSSTSSACLSYPSRIPTPSGISRSTSFLGTLSAFASRTSSITDSSENSEQPAITKPARKISERLAQTPFFSYQHQRLNTTPFFNKQKRESVVQIEQRGLMAPLHPPLPRSSTMGNLGQGQCAQHSPNTPSFMRSTSSSAAHRTSLNTPKRRNTPMPSIPSSKTPTSASRLPTTGSGGSSKPASGPHPTPSTGLASSSVTPTSERLQPAFDPGPSTSFLTAKDHSITSHSKSMTAGSHAPTLPISGPSGRTSSLPSPKERRTVWTQGKKTGRRLTSSLRCSDQGNDGTSELMALKQENPAENGIFPTGAAKASDHNTAQIDTAVSASSDDDIWTNAPTHPVDSEAEDTHELVDATAIGHHETAASPEPADPPFPLRDMSNPRLVSLISLSPFYSPVTVTFNSIDEAITARLRSTQPSTLSNGPAATPPSPTASAQAPSPPHPPARLIQHPTPPPRATH